MELAAVLITLLLKGIDTCIKVFEFITDNLLKKKLLVTKKLGLLFAST
jgi:hypothetical protein